MSRTRKPALPPSSKIITPAELPLAIKTIERRLNDLSNFDVSVVNERGDSSAEALRAKVNSSMAELFGEGSPDYIRYSISTLDTLPIIMGQRWSVHEIQGGFRKGIERAAAKLESLRDLFAEKQADAQGESIGSPLLPSVGRQNKNEVFVVHGHDEEAKQAVARFLTQLKLTPVILHEVANQGRTIIEKLEDQADVDFAVILLTPDDIGADGSTPDRLRSRARQNVVLELGMFIGRLGRKKVCAIYKGDIELPSDYSGVLFVPMDLGGGWKLALTRELRHAGLDIDLNDAM